MPVNRKIKERSSKAESRVPIVANQKECFQGICHCQHGPYQRNSSHFLPIKREFFLFLVRASFPNPNPNCVYFLNLPFRPCTWFERVSMMAILLNCVTLGMYQPCSDDENCTTPRCKVLQMADDVIFAFFAVEMCIKMLAMGITGAKSAYLSDTWNRLDCFIVIAGYAITFLCPLPPISSLSSLAPFPFVH